MLNESDKCLCATCSPNDPLSPYGMRMIVCEICGNKRCPHATYHGNACTNSNEPGQKGSSWENYKVPEPRKVEIVKVYDKPIWIETDMMGDYHIMMKHDAPGFKPFCYASLHYDYAYTSNSGIRQTAYDIMNMLGVPSEDVTIKQRDWPKHRWYHTVMFRVYRVWWWITRKFK